MARQTDEKGLSANHVAESQFGRGVIARTVVLQFTCDAVHHEVAATAVNVFIMSLRTGWFDILLVLIDSLGGISAPSAWTTGAIADFIAAALNFTGRFVKSVHPVSAQVLYLADW